METAGPAGAKPVAQSNEEAHQAWDGPLFDRFVEFRDLLTTGLGAHGEAALAAHPPNPGDGSSMSAAASAMPLSDWCSWFARTAARSASTSPRT